jgi:hypothetical protein
METFTTPRETCGVCGALLKAGRVRNGVRAICHDCMISYLDGTDTGPGRAWIMALPGPGGFSSAPRARTVEEATVQPKHGEQLRFL